MAGRARRTGGAGRGDGGAGWLFLIGGALCAVGIAVAGWQAAPTLVEWTRARSWVPVEATLLAVELDRSHGARRPTTSEVRARYRYAVDGRSYEADRVALDRGKDNIGDYQTRMHAWLKEQARRKRTVTAWVDPADPARAILDRDMRWGLFALKATLAAAFIGVGGLFVLAAVRPPPPAATAPRPESGRPWLERADWRSPRIAPQAGRRVRNAWLLALLLAATSAPLLAALPREWERGNWAASLGLVFPVAAIALGGAAAIRTREWRRFGEAVLELDPHPGAIGGQFGASVQLPRLPRDAVVEVRLACIRRRVERSRGNRRIEEDELWSATTAAGVAPGSTPPRLSFCFDVPAGLPTSDLATPPGIEWRVRLFARLPGADLDRSYAAPVFATGARSENRRSAAGAAQAVPRSGRIEFEWDGPAFALRQRAWRAPWSVAIRAACALLLGWSAWSVELLAAAADGILAIAGVAGAASLGVAAAGFAWSAARRAGHSRDVRLDATGAEVEERLFGLPWRTFRVAADRIRDVKLSHSLAFQTGEGRRAWRRLTLTGERPQREIADSLPDEMEARAVHAAARRALGLDRSDDTVS